jgi:endonuclease/exonuclease/phosphatase family metal-dependent hydrolase
VLRVISYNVRKGVGVLKSKNSITLIAQALRDIDPDVIFLQEVVHGGNLEAICQIDELMGERFPYHAFEGARNLSLLQKSGNAILSKLPIKESRALDIRTNRLEARNCVYVQMEYNSLPLHGFCVHLNLLGRSRLTQSKQIIRWVREVVLNESEPIIFAGDFNDWGAKLTPLIEAELMMREAFKSKGGAHAKTFPSLKPVLTLDRVYQKGFKVINTLRPAGVPWNRLSDHLPLIVDLDKLQGTMYQDT